MPEYMDELDRLTNADVWSKFNYAKGQWELWQAHVSRKYGISPNDSYTSAGTIIRGTGSIPPQSAQNSDSTPGTAEIPKAFTEGLKEDLEQPA